MNPLEPLNPLKTIRVMGRFVRRQVKPSGAMPGTLVHTGRKKMERTRITFLDFDEEDFAEAEVGDIGDVLPFRDSPTVSWVNIDGLHDVELIRRVGDHFGIHPLVLEDIVHVGQRPKAEVYDDYLYVVVSMLSWDDERKQVEDEQLSLIVGDRWVLTFQERIGDFFEPVRERLRHAKGKIRQRGGDYLSYALIDAVVDRYYGVLEPLGEEVDELELDVMDDPDDGTMRRLHHVKRELVAMRRAVAPVREVAADLIRTESPLMTETTRVFLRDIKDHGMQLGDAIESIRDVSSGLMDLYFSTVSNRANEVMKVLTIMASIFIPLTFLAGIYGMNFEHMPELAFPWAYPTLLAVMAVVGVGMVVWFRRKGWL